MADRPMIADIQTFRWLGCETMHLDQVVTTPCGHVIVGCYGGHSAAGADRNEDACLVWCAADGR